MDKEFVVIVMGENCQIEHARAEFTVGWDDAAWAWFWRGEIGVGKHGPMSENEARQFVREINDD